MLALTQEQRVSLQAILDTFLAELTPEETQTLAKLQCNHPTITGEDVQLMASTTCANLASNISRSSSTKILASPYDYIGTLLHLIQRTMVHDPAKLQGFLKLLWALSTSTGTALLTQGRYRVPIAQLARSDREEILNHWRQSRFHFFRSLYTSFAALTWAMSYSCAEAQHSLHQAIGYPTFDPVRSLPDYTPVNNTPRLPITHHPQYDCDGGFDVIVIGSGAGGGVVAAQVAQAGLSVLIIEKGPYYHESDYVLQEGKSAQRNLERGGTFLNEEGTMGFIAGSLIGGGTSINYSASLKLPHYVRSEWSNLGLSYFTSNKFIKDTERVCDRIGATTDGVRVHGSNQVLMDGCKNLGYHVEVIPQNSNGHSHECHWCSAGCRDGIKNGSMNTWLRDAVAFGGSKTQIMDNTKVKRIKHLDKNTNGYGLGVEYIDKDGITQLVPAKRVVVSGGSLQSPGILQRSGLLNKHIGRHLRIHPCVATFGYFDHLIDAHKGTMMTTYSDVVANIDGDHYGAKIEGVSHHPGMVANATPWRGSLDHKQSLLRWRYSTSLLTVSRDKDSYGRVFYNDQDLVKVNYVMSKHDRQSVIAGIIASANILVAAGAREIRTMQFTVPPFIFSSNEESSVDNPRYQHWINHTVLPAGAPPVATTPHEMGTCRMGTSPKVSVVKPTGETWEVKGLYVADASVFPTTSGVNPMVTIMATCLHIAEQVIDSLKGCQTFAKL
ncbi:hypothetical protein BC941DRAFT_441570 [Chlamydoabsidia padenii]|nr:hypothetical protein BC941DRAFT_441570 [Chlamydoabsidia padenii]